MEESNHLGKQVAYGMLPGVPCDADLEHTRMARFNDDLQQFTRGD